MWPQTSSGSVGDLALKLRTKAARMFNNKTAPVQSFSPGPTGSARNMEQDDVEYVQMVPYDSYDFQSAKQRASIKWLLSKAYNNKIPEELAEPFYRDHEVSKFRPHVVHGLSSAELYCLALCNLYADPNFSQLSPWGIVQALARKGVYVQAPTDVQLTETVLIQNTPLRTSAHMAVIEAMMVLQVKEIISNENLISTVQRFGPNVHPREMPADTEESLLLWINRAVLAIKDYIQNNNAHEHGLSSTQVEGWTQMPLFQDLSDLSDGVGLSALLAFYCQDELSLSEITVPTPGEPLGVSESVWNLQLIQRVCRDSLPYNVCHFSYEDILYLHESMKQNMLCFLADLFNQLELHPAPNVKLLGSNNIIPLRPGLTLEGVQIRRGFAQQQSQITIPDLRPTLYSYTTNPLSSSSSSSTERNTIKSQSATSTPKRQNSMQERNRKSSLNVGVFGDTQSGRRSPSNASVVSVPVRRSGTPLDYNEKAHSERSKEQRYYANSSEDSEEFVVHRGRNVPTLAQVIRSVSPSSQEERSSPASRMSMSRNTSAGLRDEDDESVPAAGRPSNWSANKTSYAGRRSRRNSFSEADSQLTVENFGGSQDNLNRFVIGKNPDKQPAVVDDSTASPVRYPRRQSSQEPADYYDSPPSQQQQQPQPQPPAQQQQPGTPIRQNVNYSGSSQGGGDDGPFYGKKKFNYSLEDNYGQQKQFDSKNQQEYGQYSGNFNQPPQPQFQIQSQPGYGNTYERQQPTNDGNVTVFVVNDKELTGFGEPPLRSTSMTNLSRLSDLPNKPISIVYRNGSSGSGNSSNYNNNGDRNTRGPPSNTQTGDYHTMPNTSTQHLRDANSRRHDTTTINPMPPSRGRGKGDEFDEDFDTDDIASQLAAIRLKLEEKRKRIEMEKGRMESIASKQQFKLGKAAYLKAINKGKSDASIGSSMSCSGNPPVPVSHRELPEVDLNLSARKKQLSLKDLESKWLTKTDDECRTPEIENMDEYTYQRSLAKMDTSLSELETDIHRLATQQQQIQQQHNQQQQAENPYGFFLHGDTSTDSAGSSSVGETVKRKTWAVPTSNSVSGVNSVNGGNSSTSRNQWGSPKPYSATDPSEPSVIKYNGEVRTGNSPYVPSSGTVTTSTKPTPPSKPSVISDVNSSGNISSGSGASNNNSSFRLHSQGARLFNRPSEESDKSNADQRPTPPPRRNNSNYHAAAATSGAAAAPVPDDMEPQSVSFVQDDRAPSSTELASINSSKKSLQITSGSKTYRITPETGSPPRRSAHRLFNNDGPEASLTSSDENPSLNERGFYIQLDNDGPKRPKPPLRTKSPAKKRESGSNVYEPANNSASKRVDIASEYIQSIVDRVPISNLQDDDEEEEDFRVFHHNRDEYSDSRNSIEKPGGELVIDERPNLNSSELDLMEKKKERILLQSLKRQQQQEELRRIKEMEIQRRKDEEAAKADEKMRKREEEKARKQAILESYRMKKQEELEKDGKGWEVQESSTKRFMRPKSSSSRPRPKTIHLSEVDSGANSYSYKPHGVLRRSDSQNSSSSLARSQGKRGSNSTLYSAGGGRQSSVRDLWGSTSSLNQDTRRRAVNRPRPRDLSTSRIEARSRRDSYLGSQDSLAQNRANSASSLMDGTEQTDPTTSHRDSDSGVGTCSPPQRRTPSPSPNRATHSGTSAAVAPSHTQPSCSLPSPSGPGSLPPGLISRRRGFDDGSSDISSVASSNMDYSGLRLYKQPTAKSNRSIILNAVEYCVFPGVVNRDHKLRVLDEVNRSESKHFLIMFRDAGCQFRALYSYSPERNDEIILLYGRGPKQVTDRMFEKFFKYNSGGKCFTQVHTKHLTVTIDAFTIHNALWQGKKPPQTKTRDMALVI